MKTCPTCRKSYADDSLNFCLEDGSVLTFAASVAAPTVMMPAPAPTNPNPPITLNQQGPQASWDQLQQHSMQPPKKSSKTWLWVVGLLGLGLLLCGGGIVGIIVLAVYNADTNSSSNTNIYISNTKRANTNSVTAPPSDGRTKLETVDMAKWDESDSSEIEVEYSGGELFLATRRSNYYYVMISTVGVGRSTENANTRLTVRNADDADSSMGYGLVFHSSPSPLIKDYAFLIDAKKKRYRIVRHGSQQELDEIAWTDFAAIKNGSEANVLEVRDKSGEIDFYINDQKVTSIKNTRGYKNGFAGIYSGGAAKAAFSKLEIRR